jgi:hypothetical protein
MDCGPIGPQVICDELVWDKAIVLQQRPSTKPLPLRRVVAVTARANAG